MRRYITIDQAFAIEYGLSQSEAYVYAYVLTAPAWCDKALLDDRVLLKLSRRKIVADMPLVTDKPDTMYRIMKKLADKGLVELSKANGDDLVWIEPDMSANWGYGEQLGKKSEYSEKNPNNSEKNPSTHIVYRKNIDRKPQTPLKGVLTKSKFEPDLSAVDGPSRELVLEWLEYRRKIKKPYKCQESIDRMIERLRTIADGSFSKAKAIIDQAIANGWTGFFELKTNKNGKRAQTSDEILDEAYRLAKQYGAGS